MLLSEQMTKKKWMLSTQWSLWTIDAQKMIQKGMIIKNDASLHEGSVEVHTLHVVIVADQQLSEVVERSERRREILVEMLMHFAEQRY